MGKKQVPLRISEDLYHQLASWAAADFRSVNGQIEYLLTECVRQHRKNGRYVPDQKEMERGEEDQESSEENGRRPYDRD